MSIFICFISLLTGILLANRSYLTIIFAFIILFFGAKYKFKILKLVLTFIIVGFILAFINQLVFKTEKLVGIVIKSSSNYSIVKSVYGTFYVKIKGLEVGDIIRANGAINDLSFSHYQEKFNFKLYLKSFGVTKEYKCENYQIVIKNIIRINGFKNYVISSVEYKYVNLINSFIFGTTIDEFDYLSSAGILNLFRISGLNVICIIKLLDFIFKDKKVKENMTIKLIIVITFMFLSNYKIAFIRLLIAQIIRIIKKNKIRKLDVDSITAIIILILNPLAYLQAGFYLVFPLLFLLNFSSLALKRVNSWYKGYFRLLLIYFYFLPFNLVNNYAYYLFAFIFRLMLIPISQIGFGIAVLSFLPLGEMLYPVLDIICKILNLLDRCIIKIPVGELSLLYFVLYYIFLILIIYLCEIYHLKWMRKVLIVFIIYVVIPIVPINIPKYEVHFIDVDQGDATLIRYKNKNYLIDTGGLTYVDLAKECLIPYFAKLRIKKIDRVYITHMDFDHYGALDSLVNNFKIESVLYNEGDDFIKDINVYKDKEKDTNYNSSVFSFKIKNTSFLIMGDAPKEIERKLISSIDSNIDVLKVGHHGSNTSSSYEFLKYIRPKFAVISCGLNNKYNHPSASVIDTLNSLNIKYIRTDLNGTFIYKC